RPGFFLPVRVLSRLFRRLFLERLTAAHQQLAFFGNHAPLANGQAFAAYLAPLRKTEWVVYSKRPFGGPEAVLAYLSRYTHHLAKSAVTVCATSALRLQGKARGTKGPNRQKQLHPTPHPPPPSPPFPSSQTPPPQTPPPACSPPATGSRTSRASVICLSSHRL